VKLRRSACLFLLFACSCLAQRLDPVQWVLSVEPSSAPPGSKVVARLTARLEPGWHLYSLSTPAGPIPTSLRLAENLSVSGHKVYQPRPVVTFDPNFKLDTETFEKEVVFLIEAALTPDAPAGAVELAAQVRYQACDARQCLLPVRKTASAPLRVDPSAPAATTTIPAGYSLFEPGKPAPVKKGEGGDVQGLGAFLALAFGFGLAAIFTPCVFPMIPITVSFFLKREKSLVQALVFCLGIIVLFSLLGLVTTAIVGPFGVVQLASNAWVNAFIALVFLAFGLSLLGAFEITIPSSVLTKMDRASQRSGILGTLLMGLTFSLTAFACVGPFVGTLLAGSVSGGGIRPLAGMVAFASGLALPFFLLALFPSYLGKLPKSGQWMARVKIVLGFIILAAMLKYVSNVDAVLQWNVLTRERFLAAWVILFALPGLYLLGFLRLEGFRGDEKLGLVRLFAGAAFLVFALSLLPGMFGGRLGELDAYVPLSSQLKLAWMKNQYGPALARGRAEGKRIFVNFTGYA
jgi:thiol:disulfide interchange protein